MLHHHTVPGRVVRHQVHDDLHSAFMRFSHELLEIRERSIIGIDCVIIADGVRTPKFAFAEFFADGLDRHDPKNGHAQILQLVQFRGDAIEVARRGKVARENFINDALPQPCRSGLRRFTWRNPRRACASDPKGQAKRRAKDRFYQPKYQRRSRGIQTIVNHTLIINVLTTATTAQTCSLPVAP